MWAKLLLKIGLAILGQLPIERIVAWALNRMLAKIDAGGSVERAARTAGHLVELADLFRDILDDRKVTEAEAKQARACVIATREEILAEWAKGRTAKALQRALPGAVYGESRATGKDG